MPTTTTIATATNALSLKATQSSSSSALATLRSLYPRAARAFLQRDVPLTHSLLSSAFSVIQPPESTSHLNDTLAPQRRKWDILRITFETTLYSSPPSSQDLPPSLRANLMLSSESLITSLHSRSLYLFTPTDSPQPATSTSLPAQILVTLVLASMKLDCPEVGRAMIEDWLAKHSQQMDADDPAGYAKVLELYCLHVLPKLQDWEYAQDFLGYESELPSDVRQRMTTSVRQLRAEAASASHPAILLDPSPSPSSSSTPSRSPSPAHSDSSASSSSTHTATPRSPRTGLNGRTHALTPLTPSHSQSSTPKPRDREKNAIVPPYSASSSSIASTVTSRTVTPQTTQRERTKAKAGQTRQAVQRTSAPDGHINDHAHVHAAPQDKSRSRSSTPAGSIARRSSFGHPTTNTARSPSTYALIRASFDSLVRNTSRSQIMLYAVLFVVIPIVSFVFRRRRHPGIRSVGRGGGAVTSSNTHGSAVDAVRRRLRGVDGQSTVVGKLWEEVARVVVDTVKMAGRGLV